MAPAECDWEAALRQQNAANDELCSENGRLRAEIARLHEEQRVAAEAVADLERLPAHDSAEQEALAPEEELLRAAIVAAKEILAEWELPERQQAGQRREGMKEEEEEGASFAIGSEEFHLEAQQAEQADPDEQPGPHSEPMHDERFLAVVEIAMQTAMHEEAESSTPAPTRTPAEETAVLISEKVALRELVEKQQERIEFLEMELHAAGATLPLAGSGPGVDLGAAAALGGALSTTLSQLYAARTDAGEALSAGLSAVLAPKPLGGSLYGVPGAARIATVGAEYEVVGRRGAMARKEESLDSEVVRELPPGSRVRVTAVSALYPRRVEIVCMGKVGAGAVEAPSQVADSPALGSPCPAETSGEIPPEPAPEPPSPPPVQEAPVVGWISACTKDGTMLIRPLETKQPPSQEQPGAGGSSQEEPSPEPESREEGNEEVTRVTLSAEEWDCLHQDHETSLRTVEALSLKLNEMGCELLQSFEMRSVLSEMDFVVERARERVARMGETVALASEELAQRRAEVCFAREARLLRCDSHLRTSHEDDRLRIEAEIDPEPSQAAAPARGTCTREPSEASEEIVAPPRNDSTRSCESVDWDRMISERETTANALYAALQRLACLEKEADELQEEKQAALGRGQGELLGLRSNLRRLAARAVSRAGLPRSFFTGPAKPAPRSGSGEPPRSDEARCSSVAPAGGDGLFRHRLEDLQQTVKTLRAELRRAASSEAALRRSVEARSNALRSLLHRGATAGLAPPQCGPLKLPLSVEAEIQALRLAVEEQLRWNLELRKKPGPGDGSRVRSRTATSAETAWQPQTLLFA